MNKRAAITGVTGAVGMALLEKCIREGYEVLAICRRGSTRNSRIPSSPGIIVLETDLSELDLVILPDDKPCETFYHLAWDGATGAGRDDEELQTKNIARTVAALKAAKRVGCRRFVALGTVYEKLVPQVLLASEHRKADFYLLSKQSAHYMCLKLARKLDIEFVWATIFQPIGRYIKKEQVMTYAINGLLKGEPPEFGPAMEPYDITAVEDIAYGLRLLGEKTLTKQEYYIGSGSPMLMKEYLQRTKEVLGVDTELKIGCRPDDGLRFMFDWYDISAIKKDTGYSTRMGFDQAVLNVAEWVRSGEMI